MKIYILFAFGLLVAASALIAPPTAQAQVEATPTASVDDGPSIAFPPSNYQLYLPTIQQ